ncbi:Inhibitor of growth protein 3 [Nibea albiflora]|uniref:Inhibitor of growth protein 3 n=1 Tax=Nibea albiflora TaxID=240163 RepID=A0ACB7ETD7_NIBAL|nr:Inhibitor of growth protein 3 [Nibea albiflora]
MVRSVSNWTEVQLSLDQLAVSSSPYKVFPPVKPAVRAGPEPDGNTVTMTIIKNLNPIYHQQDQIEDYEHVKPEYSDQNQNQDLDQSFSGVNLTCVYVSDATDQLEQKVIEFFVNAKKNKPEWREEQMEVIKKVDRHLRKLDQELAKFKMELEADNAGITEILERQRKYSAPAHHTTEHVPEKKFKSEALLSTLTSDASKENTPAPPRPPTTCTAVNSSQPLASYKPELTARRPGAGAGAITMAAAQAVQATAQMKDGRRTSSLKASYEAIKNNDFQLRQRVRSVPGEHRILLLRSGLHPHPDP